MMDCTITKICPQCGTELRINFEEYISNTLSTERNMGIEMEYIIEEAQVSCTSCQKEMKASGSIYEYPVGAYSSDSILLKDI